MTVLSQQEFHQQIKQMGSLAKDEPIFVTDSGKIVGVYLSYAQYQKQTANSVQEPTLLETFGKHVISDETNDLTEMFEQELKNIRQSLNQANNREVHF